MIYVPFLSKALGTYPLNLTDWGIVAVSSLIPFLGLEVYKMYLRKKQVVI